MTGRGSVPAAPPGGRLWSVYFLPLFVTQFLGALNDNLFKNALVVLVILRAGASGPALVAAAGGVFILPYLLFSAVAGQLADRLEKSRLIRATKLWEIGLMLAGAAGFLLGSVPLLMAVLFGLGVQATVFGPVKYAILPDHLPQSQLLAGNARIEAGTFAGILLGTIAGGLLILPAQGAALTAAALLLLAAAGLGAAWLVPPAGPAAPDLQPDWNISRATWGLLRHARESRSVWRASLGLGWFWALGAVFLAEFPVLAAREFGAGGGMVTLLLTMFVLGIGAGSLLAGWLLGGEISARHVPAAALLLSGFGLDFGWTCLHPGPWRDVPAILASARGWRVLLDLFAVAVCGGVFSVPLYTLVQALAPLRRRARAIAALNVVNAACMVASAAAVAALAAAGMPAAATVMLASGLNLAMAAALWRFPPRADRLVARDRLF